MRLRNIPGAKEAIENSRFVVHQVQEKKGRWNQVFGNNNPIHIEVGMGKGRFIMELAQSHPKLHFIGIERYSSVLLRALQKRSQLELANIRRLMSLNVDGILISSISIVEEHRELLGNSPVPVVVLAQEYPEGISVVDDDYEAGFAMGKYVGETHPRRAAYLGVTEEDRAVGVVRKRGVLDGLKSCGVDSIRVLTGDYSYESGQNMTGQLLAEGGAQS